MNEEIESLKQRLQSYADIQRDIDIQIERLEKMQEAIQNPAIATLTHGARDTSSGIDKIGRKIGRIEELDSEIRKTIAAEREENKALEEVIQMLPYPDQKSIIRMRYFDRMEWVEIANTLFPHVAHKTALNKIFKLHRTALEDMAAFSTGNEN